jgi:hypothetical protein
VLTGSATRAPGGQLGEMLKALPAKAVARCLQVESRVDTLIELGVASQIALVY